jgi:tRNA A-37 threonylcarbamoyl transferase component Bud32
MTDGSQTQDPGGIEARLAPGTRIAGYVIEEPIGKGGMGVVFRARDERLHRPVALKVLAPDKYADAESRARFIRESLSVAAVDEPHIIPVYQAGEDDGMLYIATRFVPGGDLAALLRREADRLSVGTVVSLVGQVAAALDAAHAAHLVHRDVKPGNILVDVVQGRPVHAYLSDFGLAKAACATTLTAPGRFMGTPDYCAPEQIECLPVNGQADQYSLACVALELLTRTPLYKRPEAARLNDPVPRVSARPGLPAAVDAVLERALAKEPGLRYPSCREFAAALRDALPASLITGAFDKKTATSGTASRPRKTLLIAGLTAVVIAVGAITVLTLPRGSREPSGCGVQNCVVLEDRAGQPAVFNGATAVFSMAILGYVHQTGSCWPYSSCSFDKFYKENEVFQLVRQSDDGGCLQTDSVHPYVSIARCGSHDAYTYWMTFPGGRPGICGPVFWLVNVGITNSDHPVSPYGYAMVLGAKDLIYVQSHRRIGDDDQWCLSPFSAARTA